jgi:branched-chain amino acid transport system substrate-binding protein
MHARNASLKNAGVKAVAVLGALSLLLAACGGGSNNASNSSGGSSDGSNCSGGAKTLEIADIDEFSGAVNIYSGPAYNGAQLAVDEINAAGGIKAICGDKLSLKKFDTQSNPDQGVPQATKAVADNPVAIIGGSQGATVLAASNVTHRKGIPWLTTALSSNQITDRGYTDLFMAADGHSTATGLLALLKGITPTLGLPTNAKVAYVSSQGTFGVSSHDSWKALPDNPYQTVSEITYPATTTDYSAVATRVASVNADIILAGCYPGDCVALERLWKTTVKPKAKVVVVLGASTASLVSALNTLADGLLLGGAPEPGQAGLPPSFQTMHDAYKAKFGSAPSTSSFPGYINVKFIAKALESAKTTDPKKLTAAVHATTIDQTEGNVYATPKTIAWNARGTYTQQTTSWVQIENAQAKIVFPDISKQTTIKPYSAG